MVRLEGMSRHISISIYADLLFILPFGTDTRVLAVTIASELAAARADVHGSGTFLPALIDELGNLTGDKIKERAKVTVID